MEPCLRFKTGDIVGVYEVNLLSPWFLARVLSTRQNHHDVGEWLFDYVVRAVDGPRDKTFARNDHELITQEEFAAITLSL